MKKKLAFVAASVLLALAVVSYISLISPPPEAPAESPLALEPAISGDSHQPETPATEQEPQLVFKPTGSETIRPVILDTSPIRRDSRKSGALTEFRLKGGDIGFLVVDSVMQDRDPHSLLALLRAHRDLTGADESLELVIWSAEELPGGLVARFYQLIDGKPTEYRGSVLMDSSGAVKRVDGEIIDPQGVRPNALAILRPEAEVIALQAATRYAATLQPWPELRDLPMSVKLRAPFPGELQHVLDSDNELRAVWRILISIGAPSPDNVVVLVDAETGEVISTMSSVIHQAASCDKPTFRVCDAQGNTNSEGELIRSCDHSSTTLVWDGRRVQVGYGHLQSSEIQNRQGHRSRRHQ